MNRPSRLLVVAAVTVLSLGGRDACVANVNFPFNASKEDWEFGVFLPASGTNTPYWFWEKNPSKDDGAIKALLLASGSGAGAWAMSPCLEINNSGQKGEILVDISHFTLFPDQILGQVQYQVTTGTGSSGWLGVPSAAWEPAGHVVPTGTAVFPPLLSSSGTFYDPSNNWLAFSGTNISSGTTGAHILSQFTLTYGATNTILGPGVNLGDEIMFRFVLGVDSQIPVSGTTPATLWEVNQVNVDGVKLCKPVPEPGTLMLAAGAALVGLAAVRRRRARGTRCREP